jgi:hypothetical protein
MSTAAAAEARSKLFSTNAPSREMGANRPPGLSSPARKAKSVSAPPMKNVKMARMKMPRVGSEAKACTEVRTPDRTRKVPSRDKEKVRMARSTVHTLSASRFSITKVECTSAVPASQGMSEAFSTGSQNQKPPQPST